MRANAVGSGEDHRNSKALADDIIALETAREHLVKRIPIARGDEGVGAVLARLSGQAFDAVDVVYIVDDAGGLQGLVPLANLLVLPQDQRMRDVITVGLPTVNPDEDQEHVVGLAVEHHLTAMPVVDALGRLLGVVPAQALMAILRREHIEDLHRLAGIQRENARARDAIEASPIRRARARLPWLLVGFLGSFLATFVMSRFERLLEARLAVAFFIPGIVYLADAIGTQTEAIAVRGLSLSHASLINAEVGQPVGAQGVVRLVSATLEIRLDVDESNLADLAVGQEAVISSSMFPGQTFPGRVAEIGAAVDQTRGTITVRVPPQQPPDWLRPGQTVNVNIITHRAVPRLLIPASALSRSGDQAVVYVVENGRALEKVVLTRPPTAQGVPILAGLGAEDRIISDARGITAGARVRVRE